MWYLKYKNVIPPRVKNIYNLIYDKLIIFQINTYFVFDENDYSEKRTGTGYPNKN